MSKKRAQAARPKAVPSFARWFLGNVFRLLRRHGGGILCSIAAVLMVRDTSEAFAAYAGRQSNANLLFNFMGNVNVLFTGSIAVSGFSIVLYWKERRQHRETRKRLAARITELELKLDPKRTSSKLTEEGLTRREDE